MSCISEENLERSLEKVIQHGKVYNNFGIDKRLKLKSGTKRKLWIIKSGVNFMLPEMWAWTVDPLGKLIFTGVIVEYV